MQMKKLSTLLNEATLILGNSGVETPRLDAELIVQRALGISAIEMILGADMPVKQECAERLSVLLDQRSAGVPMSHILGKREFWSMDFTVDSNVLDPRADTETVVSSAIRVCGNQNRRITIADLGTGTGCILIALLAHYRYATGVAFEKSVKAYRVAYKNFMQHSMLARVKLRCASWERCEGKFDLIVSNPPYIKRCKIPGLQREVRCHEPLQALDGGARGMENYLQIFKVLRRCLHPHGRAILEIGEDQSTIRNEALYAGMGFCGYGLDLSGRKRCIILKRLPRT
ncbi:peptide chain release factor N(5)-glutamine methyltransferase [Anaplasma capra]|uniref:peptide chain release factor N(5)-glutamine methyltransferase n=1 Tax=Anaplasma capra TaxID=1562740 RepID=UPI0021D600AC|nr:peptide chain release factor N(5)-glutamine methyltransferase [Anaplasma capra]MCU7612712.1 peptide chain release factor N(5)-glutamine methyltransferase [Anaplasma capra]